MTTHPKAQCITPQHGGMPANLLENRAGEFRRFRNLSIELRVFHRNLVWTVDSKRMNRSMVTAFRSTERRISLLRCRRSECAKDVSHRCTLMNTDKISEGSVVCSYAVICANHV